MADADGQEDTGTLPPQYYQRKIRVLLQERSDMEAEAEELVAEVEALRRQRSELPPLVADLLATAESHKPTDILDEASSTAAAAAQLEAFGQTLLCQVRDIQALLQEGSSGGGGGGGSAAAAANGTAGNGTVAIVARRPEDEYDNLSPSPQPATPPTAIAPTPVATARAIEGPPAPAQAAFEVPASLVSLAPERFEHCSTLDDCMRVFYDVLTENSELQEESDVQTTLVSAQARKLQRKGVEIRELEALLNQRQQEAVAAPTPQPASSAATHSPSTPSEWASSVAGSSAGLLPPPPAAAAAAAPPVTAAPSAPAATSGASLVSRSASSGTARVPTKSRSPLPQARGTVGGGALRTSVTAHSITTLSPKTSYEAERMPHGPIGSHRPRPLSRR